MHKMRHLLSIVPEITSTSKQKVDSKIGLVRQPLRCNVFLGALLQAASCLRNSKTLNNKFLEKIMLMHTAVHIHNTVVSN